MAYGRGLLIKDDNGFPIQKAAILSTVDGSSDSGATGSITAMADATGGQVTVTSEAHGLVANQMVTISGTDDYDETYKITNITADTFEITATYVSSQTGTWALAAITSPVSVSSSEVKIVIPKYCAEIIIYATEDIIINNATGVSASNGFLVANKVYLKFGVEPGSSLFLIRVENDATVYVAYQNLQTA